MVHLKKIWLAFLLLALFSFFYLPSSFAQEEKTENRVPVKIEGKKFLPLRVLARPMSNIYKEPDENSVIVEENVQVFQNYFVYTRPDQSILGTEAKGWYEVGINNRGDVLGWMKAQDVMEWKQTMCLSYEHPMGRKPVLMFSKIEPLREMINMPPEEREKNALNYYETIKSKEIPPDFPVVSMEPEAAIDITEEFYLLPILEHAEVQIQGREGRMLKMASAPKNGRAPTPPKEFEPPPVENPDVLGGGDPAILEKLKMDIVYVVDMTASMQPYIDATLKTIQEISQSITADAEIKKSVRFGLWGYRDSLDIPGIEFVTKNFTPQLQEVDEFQKTLEKVKVVKVGSQGYDEDVFSGMDKAMRETKWTEEALHFITLLGDAPGHGAGHKWNLSKQSEETLRAFADSNKHYIFSVHIKDKDAKRFWDTAETQFKTLSQNKGMQGQSAYFGIDSKDGDAFAMVSNKIAERLLNIMKQAKSGKVSEPIMATTMSAPTTASTSITATDPGASAEEMASDFAEEEAKVSITIDNVGYAALVEWIGSQTNPESPRDIIAWVTDKDLIDPTVQSLDVRTLVNKRQLDSLTTVLQKLLEAGSKGLMSGQKFFTELQSVSGLSVRDIEKIKVAKTFAETGLVPEFLDGLPYQSQIMSMSDDLWNSWGPDQQQTFLDNLDAKIQYYTNVHDTPNGWVALNKGDDPDEHVYPLSLDMLP